MSTIITLSSLLENPSICIDALQSEIVIIYPTDTVYGIGGIITQSVSDRIGTIKNRPLSKRYSILAPSFDRIDRHTLINQPASEVRPALQKKHATSTITLLLPTDPTSGFPRSVISDSPTIGVRYLGDHPMQQLVAALGAPIITTSCNRSGHPPITDPADALNEFNSNNVLIIDGGVCKKAPSTIIDYATGTIIR